MAVPFSLIYTVRDAQGDTSTTQVHMPTAFNLAQYTEFAASMATLIDAMLHGRVETAELCLSADLSGLTSNTILTTSDVEEVAAFVGRTTEGRPVEVNIPALNDGVVVAGTNQLDLADPSVAAFITMLEDGIAVTGGTATPCDVGEDDIDTVISATKEVRGSGKRVA